MLLSLKAIVSLCFYTCEDYPAHFFKILFPSVTTVCYKSEISENTELNTVVDFTA